MIHTKKQRITQIKHKNNSNHHPVSEQITLVNDILGVLVFCMASPDPDSVTPSHFKLRSGSNVNNVAGRWGWQSFIIADIYYHYKGFGE